MQLPGVMNGVYDWGRGASDAVPSGLRLSGVGDGGCRPNKVYLVQRSWQVYLDWMVGRNRKRCPLERMKMEQG